MKNELDLLRQRGGGKGGEKRVQVEKPACAKVQGKEKPLHFQGTEMNLVGLEHRTQ